jgi:hypothetical protein
MRRRLVENARRMTPEQRLQACLNLTMAVAELHRAGESHRAGMKIPMGK